MIARYVVRLDDACPTMSIEKWDRIEKILDFYDIKPIVAVIPNNKDPKLKIDEHDAMFWDKVRKWQDKGWMIALHGYDHVYITKEKGIIPFNNKSEFAGLNYKYQAEKIKKGIEVFAKNNVSPRCWVAPSHSFDTTTLEVLTQETDIDLISDGISYRPFSWKGFNWIPQQFWKTRVMFFGLWTICLHPNVEPEEQFVNLDLFFKKNAGQFISPFDIRKYKTRNVLDYIFHAIFLGFLKIKRKLK